MTRDRRTVSQRRIEMYRQILLWRAYHTWAENKAKNEASQFKGDFEGFCNWFLGDANRKDALMRDVTEQDDAKT